MEKPNVVINEVLLVKELPKIEFKKQFSNKATSTDLVMVDIPLITIDEVICQSKDVVTPINTKISNIVMTTQVNHDKLNQRLRRINLSGYHIDTQITEFIVQESTYQYPKVPNQSQCCTYILKHPKIYAPQSQQQRRSNPKSYHQRVPERIHLGWIDPFSMQQYCSRLQTSYHLVSSTLSNR
jgi:mannosyltransferase OCH1-like enzyme